MNNTVVLSTTCSTSYPWWLTYTISLGIFVLGFIIIAIIQICVRVKRHSKPNSKINMLRRKSRLLMNPVIGEGDSDFDEWMEDDIGMSSSRFIEFSIWCERITSQRSSIGRISCLFLVILNLLSWSIYIAFTYYQTTISYLEGDCYSNSMKIAKWIDFGLNIFFALHFTLRAFAAMDIIKFWILPATLIDICVIPNVCISTFLPVRRQGMSFLRIYYIRHLYEVIFVNFGLVRITSKTKIFNLSFYLISVWMIGSGFIHMEENTGDFWLDNTNKQNWSFWISTYFLLETVSTVGYGDYNPRSFSGQVIVCIYIIYAITLFATSLPEIIYAIKDSKYNEKYITRNGEKHMIVTGQFINSTMKTFLKVFINKKTRKQFRNMKIVIMNNQPCDRVLSLYLKKFSSSIMYLMGSIQNISDMERVNLHKSKTIFILSLPYTNKIYDDDSENIMAAISLKAQEERIRTIVQLHLYSNKILLKMFPRWNKYKNDVVVCLDELRLGLMAYNCLAPGMATLVANLMTCTEPMKTHNLWRKEYEEGLQNRLYNVEFSIDFHGMPCLDVAIIIYKLWDVCLLAIKHVNNDYVNSVTINPMAENVKIDTLSMIGIVMARDESYAHRVPFFCSKCSNTDFVIICDCQMKSTTRNNFDLKKVNNRMKSKRLSEISKSSYLFSLMDNKPYRIDSNTLTENIDETETFFWAPAPKLDEICIDVRQAEKRKFSNHILLCLCGSGEGTIDLCNFMMPLRFRSLTYENLRPVVILGNKKYFEDHKWSNIKNFPMFVIINGSPIQARDVRAAGLFDCYSCAILNGNDDSSETSDKQSLICATLIRSMLADLRSEFNLITEIREDEVACHFSSTEAFDVDNKMPVQHSEPYAGGLLFTNSILYRCIYSIYHNPDTFSFVSALINGSRGELVEKMFGCGVGLIPKKIVSFKNSDADVVFQLIPINDNLFNNVPNLNEGIVTYGILYEWALKTKHILCLGLYRLNFGKHRYVYTHPKKSTEILMTDKIYCSLIHSNIQTKI